jgi:SAM-dependent methyltransferase
LYSFVFLFVWGCTSTTNPLPKQEMIVQDEDPDSSLIYLESDNTPDRVIWQKPDLILDLLGDMYDKVVADIGAGTGFFTFRLLQHAKKVIAVDIDKAPLDKMAQLANKLDTSISNKLVIKVIKPSDPQLDPHSVDIVLLSNTYMYIQNRVNYLKTLKAYLKKDARVLIIDYKKKNLPFGPPIDERVNLDTVEKELLNAGYNIQKSDDVTLDYQYIVLANVKQ